MAEEINPGDVVVVTTAPGFKDAEGVLTDPTTVRLRWLVHTTETLWEYPTDPQIVKDSEGLYHADIPVTVAGMYRFRWEAEGNVVAAEEGSFRSVTKFSTT